MSQVLYRIGRRGWLKNVWKVRKKESEQIYIRGDFGSLVFRSQRHLSLFKEKQLWVIIIIPVKTSRSIYLRADHFRLINSVTAARKT